MKFSVRGRITLACGILLGAILVVAGVGVHSMNDSNARADDMLELSAAATLAAQVRADIARTARAERDLVLADSDDSRKLATDSLDQSYRDREERRRQLRAVKDPELARKLDELDATLREFDDVDRQVRAVTGKAAEALIRTKGLETITRAGKLADDMVALEQAAITALHKVDDEVDGRARIIMLFTVLGALALGVVLAALTIRYISRSAREM